MTSSHRSCAVCEKLHMPRNTQKPAIQVDQDLAYQSKFWKIERVGWAVFLLFLIISLLGLTGSGPLSSTQKQQENLQVKYNSFARELAPTQFEITINDSKDAESTQLWIDRTFLSNYQIQQITPEPDKVTSDGDRLIYEFKKNAPPAQVTFLLQPQKFGYLNGKIGQDRSSITLSQLVYP